MWRAVWAYVRQFEVRLQGFPQPRLDEARPFRDLSEQQPHDGRPLGAPADIIVHHKIDCLLSKIRIGSGKCGKHMNLVGGRYAAFRRTRVSSVERKRVDLVVGIYASIQMHDPLVNVSRI